MPTMLNVGHLTIGGVAVPTDPETYEPEWDRRYSEFAVLDGGRVIQDFGRFAKDATRRLVSGAQYIDFAAVQALDALHAAGAPVAVTDWEGNDYDGYITRWRATPSFIGNRAEGTLLYTWEMELRVTTIRSLYGAVYTGD